MRRISTITVDGDDESTAVIEMERFFQDNL